MSLEDRCGWEEGAPPPLDRAAERRNGRFVRQLIRSGQVTTVHNLSAGGIALGLAEMAMAGGVGAEITAYPEGFTLHAFLFGEDQARYLIAVDEDVAADILYEAGAIGIPAVTLGLTGGDALILPGQQAISVKQLRAAHEAWLPNYMTGKA